MWKHSISPYTEYTVLTQVVLCTLPDIRVCLVVEVPGAIEYVEYVQ